MKRSKASSKMANVVHSGWMTKSPPERKVNAPFKIFRAQWKKRFFVLGKPSGSLPDQYELHYYKDENCTAKKGSIDLEQCEQIIESLDSEHFRYLLAIKTIYKNKVRTYYLAVDSETEMTSWVQCLCHVCGLKQEDNPTDLPEPKPPVSQLSSNPDPHAPGHGGSNGHAGNPPLAGSGHAVASSMVINTQPSNNKDAKAKNEAGMSPSPTYIPLDQCVTGCPKRGDRSESTESMPDFNAPMAPPTHEDVAHDDDVFLSGLYHHPPKPVELTTDDDDTYKVPPARHHKLPGSGLAPDDNGNKNSLYQVPPPRSKRETRAHSDRTDSASSSNAPSENYDYPPSYKEADSAIPPERPPRAIHTQSPYQNLIVTQSSNASAPEGSGSDLNTVLAPPKPHALNNANQGYHVPRSSHYVSPPPPVPHRPNNQHRGYMNARANNQPSVMSDGRVEDVLDGKEEPDYTNQVLPTPAIPPRSGSGGEGQDARSASPSAIYHHPPPSSASSSSSSASGAPARPPARIAQRGQQPPASRNVDGQGKEEGAPIFSTSRTRSFKRQHIVAPLSNRAHTLPMSVPVPAPRPVPGDYSSSDDADDEALQQELNQQEQTHHSLSLLHSVPLPYDNERELKYVDLDLDHPETSAPEVPRSSTSHHHHHSHPHNSHSHVDRGKDSAIEYREIDFVKTKALQDTKQVKEKERKIDDH